MADLDDFFAKKDRKKSKSKKYATPQFEDNTSSDGKSKKERHNVGDEVTLNQPQEDEWKDFEEERKDYSGLKIGQLTISEEEQNQTNYGGDPDNNSEGQSEGEDGDNPDRKQSGPWKKVSSGAGGGANGGDQQQQNTTSSPADAAAKPAANKLYISPAMRNQMVEPGKAKLKKGVLPDLASEDYFPSLGTDKPDASKNRKDATFEEVKHGGRMKPSDMASAAPLSVGNRFTSLSNDAS